MTEKTIEFDIYYTDHYPVISYAETHHMPESGLPHLIDALENEAVPTFKAGGKTFIKSEVASIGFGNWAIQFDHRKQEEGERA